MLWNVAATALPELPVQSCRFRCCRCPSHESAAAACFALQPVSVTQLWYTCDWPGSLPNTFTPAQPAYTRTGRAARDLTAKYRQNKMPELGKKNANEGLRRSNHNTRRARKAKYLAAA